MPIHKMTPGSRERHSDDTFRDDSSIKKFKSATQLVAERKIRIGGDTKPVVARTGKTKKDPGAIAMSKAITGRAEGTRTYNIKGSPTILSSSGQLLRGYSSTMGRPVSSADYTPRHQGGNLNIGYIKGSALTVKGGWKPKKKNR
jgi:hypothetical protein